MNEKEQAVLLKADGYETLALVLQRAFNQAAHGKGRERHANGNTFEDQPMSVINRMLGSIDGFRYQAIKKTVESQRLSPDAAIRELLGAINYLAGAVIMLDQTCSGAIKSSDVGDIFQTFSVAGDID